MVTDFPDGLYQGHLQYSYIFERNLVPVWTGKKEILYLSIPLGYRMWGKDRNVSKLELYKTIINVPAPISAQPGPACCQAGQDQKQPAFPADFGYTPLIKYIRCTIMIKTAVH